MPWLLNSCLHLSTMEHCELDKTISTKPNSVLNDMMKTRSIATHL